MLQTRSTGLIGLPVKHGAREQALRLTRRISEACLRLGDPEDVEALHDFRVGVRRLRTFLRAYRDFLDVRKKTMKQLRGLTRCTNAPRDNEVGVEWLTAQRPALTRGQRLGANWLARRMDGEKTAAYERLRVELPLRWLRQEVRLRRSLGAPFADEIDAGSFGAVTARLIREAAEELERCLQRIETIDDEEPAHRARIAAKKVRYLIEPLRGELRGAKKAVQEIRAFQDRFGELNDTHVMIERLRLALELASAERSARLFDLALDDAAEPREIRAARAQRERAGLLELARLARKRRVELFELVRERDLGGAAAALLETMRRVAERLEPAPPPEEPAESAPEPPEEPAEPAAPEAPSE
jgi:CHAD domain-containing protein